MDVYEISIAQDFSRVPFGRYEKTSKSSGEGFRKKFLLPAIRRYDKVRVSFAGTKGCPASFVEEAFGGLVRAGIHEDELRRKLVLHSGGPENEVYVVQAWTFIQDEEARAM